MELNGISKIQNGGMEMIKIRSKLLVGTVILGSLSLVLSTVEATPSSASVSERVARPDASDGPSNASDPQGFIPQQIDDLGGSSAYASIYGGLVEVDSMTHIDVYLTTLDPVAEAAFSALAPANDLTFLKTPNSLAHLNAVQQEVMDQATDMRSQGILIAQVYPSLQTGIEQIGVVDLTTAQQDLLVNDFGSGNVNVFNLAPGQVPVATSGRSTVTEPIGGGGSTVTEPIGGGGQANLGYWLVTATGDSFPFAAHTVPNSASASRELCAVGAQNDGCVGIAGTPDGKGYWIVASDGGVFSYGDAPFYGSTGGEHLNAPIVGIAGTPDGKGYWIVASDGGVFSYGDAPFYGSTGGEHLNAPIVGIAGTPDGKGYWIVASDGGVFSYGDAPFYGSTGGEHLNAPIVGIAGTPDGKGYWIVASDGGVFSYGDAPFYGSTGGEHLNAPIVGIAGTPDGKGYWIVASDGGVFSYGDAPFRGSVAGQVLDSPVVGITASP